MRMSFEQGEYFDVRGEFAHSPKSRLYHWAKAAGLPARSAGPRLGGRLPSIFFLVLPGTASQPASLVRRLEASNIFPSCNKCLFEQATGAFFSRQQLRTIGLRNPPGSKQHPLIQPHF